MHALIVNQFERFDLSPKQQVIRVHDFNIINIVFEYLSRQLDLIVRFSLSSIRTTAEQSQSQSSPITNPTDALNNKDDVMIDATEEAGKRWRSW